MKAFISVYGKDRVGIIAGVSALLATLNINIEDISQTIMNGSFTMIMRVDISACSLEISDISQKLNDLGNSLDMAISIRHEDLFNAMHRI